ncbi:3866_t:CDS:2, partial [Cetraspora pellucida]
GNFHARIICEVAVRENVRGWKNKCALWMDQQINNIITKTKEASILAQSNCSCFSPSVIKIPMI